ncbi:M14 family zinc carboxypeptidase [Pararhizobium qamdonense]|uniref:M14 family zinc carboxypeptidase n=1 Tax=Pararhizobium qamdonense TaxID=3031126 RepID=UPI0023E136B5|nr:succinylglutamate desuccinylase/aspartoacylase family protein [Pararhizobium qamdonense]
MDISEIVIKGDTPGVEWRLPVIRFKGSDAKAPKIYIQAALHANELPGTALLHFLCEKLRQADADGKIFSDITIVPQANPIGTAQSHFGELQGRFDLGSRTNFNREFPLIGLSERETLIDDLERYPVVEQLKRQLLHMALSADLMLDLHCDDESVQYTYVDEAFWPEAADLASALDMEAVFLADGESSAFEESVGYAWKHETAEKAKRLPGRLAVTVELRGTRDVYPDMARKDAEGLWRFLVVRGAVGGAAATIEPYRGKVTPLDNIEMIRAPQAGAVLFHRDIGDTVAAGDLLATIITAPGMEGGAIDIHAPQAGLVATRTSQRFARRRDNLMKIACDEPTKAVRKPGALEA